LEYFFFANDCAKFSLIDRVKKSEGHFIVKFDSDDTQFTFTDMESAGLESFYDFVFARWKEKLANYFHAPFDVDTKRDYNRYI
jgi:hypothetical protein